jgi:hypothetical protein
LSTSFCAVPACRRVDPAKTSGPTIGAIINSTAWASAEGWVQARPAPKAPRARLGYRAENVGCVAARRDPQHGVIR